MKAIVIRNLKCSILIFVQFFSLLVFSQRTRIITGKVLSQKGMAVLRDVSVYADSKTIGSKKIGQIGTITDEKGEFKLTLPQEVKKLNFSYLGFKTKTITLSKQTYYTIYLEEEVESLQEVVITGYQKIEKRKFTGAVNELKTKDIQQVGVSNIGDLIQGQAAGVSVISQTGAPGEIAKIRVRGTSSLNAIRDPLWVVDGMPLAVNDVPNLSYYTFDYQAITDELRNYPIADLNIADIENITILKDAAATSIYGARAANGVIVITTKKGKRGKTKVNFYTNTSFVQRPDFNKLNLMNASDKVDFELSMAKRADLSYLPEHGEIARILKNSGELELYREKGFTALTQDTQNSINQLRKRTVKWDKLIYQIPYNINTGASISGGNENSDYYFSLGYYDEKGTTLGTGFKRVNLALKNHYTIFDKIKIGINLQLAQNKRENYINYYDAMDNLSTSPSYYARRVNPYLKPKNPDGTYKYDPDILKIDKLKNQDIPFNILEELTNTSYGLKTLSLNSIFDINAPITKGLNLFAQLGIQTNRSNGEKFADEESYYNRQRVGWTITKIGKERRPSLPEKGGIIENSNENFSQWNLKTQLQFDRIISNKHEIDVLIGSELRKAKSKSISSRGFGYDPKTLTAKIFYMEPGPYMKTFYELHDLMYYLRNERENAFASLYSTASYTYNRKYTIFGSIRYEGSDLFGADPKYKYLPIYAVSGAWQASKEPFLNRIRPLTDLKLRVSYGFQGNIDRHTSPFLIGRYVSGDTVLASGPIEETIYVNNPPNKELRWEKTENINVGLDLGLLKDKIQITFDAYKRKGTDLIGIQEIPLETGFTSMKKNVSQITNKGFELALTTENIRTKNFSWITAFNLAQNKSRVKHHIPNETNYFPSPEGYPVNAIFALKTAGLDKRGIPLFYKDDQKVSLVEFFDLQKGVGWFGDITFKSGLSSNEIKELFTYVGDAEPEYIGGMTNRIFYKNFDLTVSCHFNLAQTVRRPPPYPIANVDRGSNYSKDILQAHPGGNLPAIIPEDSPEHAWFDSADMFNLYHAYKYLDLWTRKMNYLRISSIRLGFTLPKNITKKLGMNQLRLNVEARNPFVFSSDYNGYFDPETYGNSYAQPIAKSISLGLNVTF